MNNVSIAFLLSFIAGISTLIGCIFLFVKVKKKDEFITFSLSFSFIIILAISLFDLLPKSVYTLYSAYKIIGLLLALITFICGSLTIKTINQKIKKKNRTNLYRVGLLGMISLLIHNIPEGVAVFMSTYTSITIGIKLCIAIMLHNIPEGIIISVPLYHSGVDKKKVIFLTFISGIAEPLGGILGYLLFKNIMNDITLSYILIFVAGLMITLAINDIIKEALSYNKYKYMFSGITIGTIFFILTLVI